MEYEVTCVGNFTKDTIVRGGRESVVNGGGFNYGCHAARALRRRTAAVTRLAVEDKQVLEELEQAGVDVFPSYCESSTCLRLEYTNEDLDERTISVTSFAEPISAKELDGLRSRAFVVGPSFRDEIDLDALAVLAERAELVSIDVQGFVRKVVDGLLYNRPWDNQDKYFHLASIIKADVQEAEFLTGKSDPHSACEILHDRGAREILLTHCDGVVAFDGHRFFDVPFVARSLDGRTGRGDTCVASYVAARLEEDPPEAILWAAALTSRKMEVPGPFRGSFDEVAETVEREYRGRFPH